MAATYRTHYEERAWIEAHREEFLDRWVALDGSKLVAHGEDCERKEKAANIVSQRRRSPSAKSYTTRKTGGWSPPVSC